MILGQTKDLLINYNTQIAQDLLKCTQLFFTSIFSEQQDELNKQIEIIRQYVSSNQLEVQDVVIQNIDQSSNVLQIAYMIKQLNTSNFIAQQLTLMKQLIEQENKDAVLQQLQTLQEQVSNSDLESKQLIINKLLSFVNISNQIHLQINFLSMIFEILLSLIEQQLLTKEYHIFLENQIYKLRKQSNNELRMWFQLERLDTLLKTDQKLIISCLQSESPFLLFNETKQQIIQQILIKKLDSKQLISGLNQEFDWRVKFAILDYSLQNQTVLLNILEQSQFNDWRLNYKLIDICYKSCNVNQKAALIILKFKLFQHDERVHQLLNQQDEMLIVKKSLQNAWQEMQANAESILQSHMNTINEYISKLIVDVKNCTDITMIVDNLLQEYQFQAKLLQRIESLSYSIDVKANYLDLFYNKLTKAKNDAHVISLNVKSINIDTIETYCTLIKENNLLQQQLLDIVIYSAKYTQYAFSSSNAISILNYSNFSFKRLNFNGIRIREANLCSAFLEGVDFTNADLTGVNFTNSWLRNSTFTGANMNAVSFGESLKLSLQCKIYALSVNKLGSMIIAAGDNGKIYQFQSNGKLIRSFNAHNGTISSLQFSPDGQNIISSSYDRTVKIWSTHNAKLLNTLNHEKSLFISTYSPDNELIASGGVDRILTIHTYEGIKLDEFQINSKVLTIDFYKTNQELACGTGDGAVQLWDIIKKRMFKELTGHSAQVNSVKFSIDGELLVSGSDDKTVIVWNARTGDAIKVIQMPGKVPCVCISDDCQYIAATCADSSVHVFDSKNNFKKIQQFYHADIVNTTCFSKKGNNIELYRQNRRHCSRTWRNVLVYKFNCDFKLHQRCQTT
ncbi:Notchless [Hexamita inflata]|uniref:Notchless n=1 Tax=Hexamita inflata TaxID=28002 RepID=A0AA86UPN8_9EUKA|nr:Notchless [Hexamita inflata]